MDFFVGILKGFIIGITAILPGVSGRSIMYDNGNI